MSTSTNPKIQQLMDEVEEIDASDPKLVEKLNIIAQKMAQEQRKVRAQLTGVAVDDSALIDPSDAFACEGCQ